MVGRQTDNNLKHYSLDQILQQPQTSYKFTGMPTGDIYMEDVSLSHGILSKCTTHSNSAFHQKKR